ncbi:MAG: tetratricopeptide repeat protein [Myxococcales bacterium]|nr:tetratricopeptide repeat protein [Myxococcales bacterium]
MIWALLWGCVSPEVPAAPTPGAVALAYEPAASEASLLAPLRAARDRPTDADAWAELAVALLQHKRQTGAEIFSRYAEDAALAALALQPEHLPALQVRIRTTHDRHRFAAAEALASEARALYPEDVTLLLLHGDALLELGRYEQAHDVLQTALDRRPDLRSYNRGAHLRWLLGDLPGAISLMERAVRAGGPGLPEPTAYCLVDLAHLQLQAGEPQRAMVAARAALALVEDYPPARSVLGRAHLAEGDPRGAIEELRDLVKDHPQVADQLLLAELTEAQGDAEEAGELRRRVALRVAEDPRAVAADLARRSVQPDRAVRLAQQAAHGRPTVHNLDTLALALLRAGRLQDAREASDRALAVGTACAGLHLTRGLIAAAAADPDAAAEHLRMAMAINPAADPRLLAELRDRLDG